MRDAGAVVLPAVGRPRCRRRPALPSGRSCRSSRAVTARASRAARLPVDGRRRHRPGAAESRARRRHPEPPRHGRTGRHESRDHAAASRRYGFYYAPDPSSQQVCSIGGNVAENSGGAHCLKYGFTVHHVLGVEAVLPNGDLVHARQRHRSTRPDPICSACSIGSEGTLAVVDEGRSCRSCAEPESVQTLLAAFDTIDAAGRRRVRDHRGRHHPGGGRDDGSSRDPRGRSRRSSGFPAADAILIVELDGPRRGGATSCSPIVEADLPPRRRDRRARSRATTTHRATHLEGQEGGVRGDGPRVAELLRAGRRRAAHEAARSARPHPGSRSASGLRIGNVFHAGDGNLHPLICYDERIPGQAEHAEEVAAEILTYCIEAGGSITGEHGVGADKQTYMPKMFSDGRPRRDAAACAARSIRRGSAIRARSFRRRGSAAKCPALSRSIRSSAPGSASASDGSAPCPTSTVASDGRARRRRASARCRRDRRAATAEPRRRDVAACSRRNDRRS